MLSYCFSNMCINDRQDVHMDFLFFLSLVAFITEYFSSFQKTICVSCICLVFFNGTYRNCALLLDLCLNIWFSFPSGIY